MAFERYNRTDDYQDCLLACLIRYPEEFRAFGEVIKPEYFSGTSAVRVAFHLKRYVKEYERYPNFTTLANYITRCQEHINPEQADEDIKYVTALADTDTDDWRALLDDARNFAKERAVYGANRKIAEAQTSGKGDEIDPVKLMEDALAVGEPVSAAKSLIDFAITDVDPNATLLGNRFLCRQGGLLFAAPTGVGKSVTIIQCAVAWACGREAFGVKPAKPLKILLVQAENDDDDMHETVCGVMKGLNLTDAEMDTVNENTVVVREIIKCGTEFLMCLRNLCRIHKPDLVMVDPLNSYLGGDVSDQKTITAFCRNGLNPILFTYNCGLMLVCHTPKTNNRERDTSKWKPSDFAYFAAGSNELANWARAVICIDPTHDPHVFRFIAGKRGGRLGWQDDLDSFTLIKCFSHAQPGKGIYWTEATPEQVASAQVKADQVRRGRGPTYTDEALLKPIVAQPLVLSDWCRELNKAGTSIQEPGLRKRADKLMQAGKVCRDKDKQWAAISPKL